MVKRSLFCLLLLTGCMHRPDPQPEVVILCPEEVTWTKEFRLGLADDLDAAPKSAFLTPALHELLGYRAAIEACHAAQVQSTDGDEQRREVHQTSRALSTPQHTKGISR